MLRLLRARLFLRVHSCGQVFHPLIHPDTGLLDISLQFPTWSSNQHYIVLLLCYIKKIFYKTEYWAGVSGKDAMNPKAQNLFVNSNSTTAIATRRGCSNRED